MGFGPRWAHWAHLCQVTFFHEWGPDERWGGLVEICLVAMRLFLLLLLLLFSIKKSLPAPRHVMSVWHYVHFFQTQVSYIQLSRSVWEWSGSMPDPSGTISGPFKQKTQDRPNKYPVTQVFV